MQFLIQAVSLLIPLVFSGLVLILFVKKGWLISLDAPLDRGVQWRNKPLLGRNKTIRGVLVHLVAATLATTVLWATQPLTPWISEVYTYNPLILGMSFALAYTAGELINSFVKRRLRIGPGTKAHSPASRRLQHFFDTADGIILVGIVLWGWFDVSWEMALTAVAMAYGVHIAIDGLMRSLGLKKS